MGIKQNKEYGGAHIAAIVVVVVVAVAGFAGWWVWHKNQEKKSTSTASQAVADAIKNAKCDYDDKDLCKFYTSWKADQNYTVAATSKDAEGNSTTSIVQTNGTTKSHFKLEGATPFEVITIDGSSYTKAGSTWYKQTLPQDTADQYKDDTSSMLPDPSVSTETSADTSTYTKIGKEACGNLICFKYKITEADGSSSLIWFDDEDYQLRRMQSTSSDGSDYSATFSYDDPKITEPSPVKELQPGQYLIPGQSEPTTIPSYQP